MKLIITFLCIYFSKAALAENFNIPILSINFGKPTYIQSMYYQKMYDKKPFREAVIFYYDNGVYKIISPGEEHYGVYVITGAFTDLRFTVRYISLPSADWGNKTAFHELNYNNKTHHFGQNALLQTQVKVPYEYGVFSLRTNNESNPLSIKWNQGQYFVK
ncbi:MAG: hypothetical protein K0R14_2161 [Burkholderiales bacterium]|jgi:hypothetical protein|nr:hypothetical protein [Burkholderiales bacterium]